MRKFGVFVAGLAMLASAALAHSDTKVKGSANAASKKLSLAQLPAKSDALFWSEGTIRVEDGIITSDKPMQVISRKTITVLHSGGIYIGTSKPGLPTGIKLSPVKYAGGLPGGPGHEAPSVQASPLVATLELAQPEPQLRLTVENRGSTTARILRLRPGWLEYNGGSLHDWQIQIEGPSGHYQFPRYTGWIGVPTEQDFIELAPGEAFSTLVRVSEANRYDGGKQYPLSQTSGSYTAIISHGSLRSNTLKFTVGE